MERCGVLVAGEDPQAHQQGRGQYPAGRSPCQLVTILKAFREKSTLAEKYQKPQGTKVTL